MSITLPPLPDATYDIGEGFERIDAYSLVDLQLYALAAVEDDRARRVPMTDEQCKAITRAWSRSGVTNFHSIVRDTEAHHGIGAKL